MCHHLKFQFQKESSQAQFDINVQTKIKRRFTGAALVLALRGIPRNDPRCVAICVRHVYRLRRAHLRSSFFRYTFRRRYVPHYLACRSLCAGKFNNVPVRMIMLLRSLLLLQHLLHPPLHHHPSHHHQHHRPSHLHKLLQLHQFLLSLVEVAVETNIKFIGTS